MTEEERKLFAGELKEHILLPSKQEDLGNDLNSVEQILVDNKYQVIYYFIFIPFLSYVINVLNFRFNIQRLTNMVTFILC